MLAYSGYYVNILKGVIVFFFMWCLVTFKLLHTSGTSTKPFISVHADLVERPDR